MTAIDQPGPIRQGEELAREKLEAYLLERIEGSTGPLTIEQFPSGYSNLTYALTLGKQELVLRRPPFGNQVKSAHDMNREFRVLSHLCTVYPPAPRPVLHCDDDEVIGDEFYVMERRRGLILRGVQSPPQFSSNPKMARRLCEVFIENLAQLHQLDYAAMGLGELGRPDGYVERQVKGWSKRYAAAKTDDVPAMDRLIAWLTNHLPTKHAGPSLIHNDYKFDNMVLGANDPTQVIAVLDWEMATVGDPLMDLGTTLAYWVEAGDHAALRAQAFGPTMMNGCLTREELVDIYGRKTGFETGDMLFYYCFGIFKLAVIVQQIYARYVRGHTSDARFKKLNLLVGLLSNVGTAAIESGKI